MKRICLLLVLCLLFSGYGTEGEPEFTKTISTSPPAASSDFSLPEGYIFSDDITASIIRRSDEQIIGGILDTEMDPESLEESDHGSSVGKYLRSLGYMCESISMNADGFNSFRLAITGQDIQERTETSRSLFPRDGKCYDLWLDIAATTDEERTAIRNAVLGK